MATVLAMSWVGGARLTGINLTAVCSYGYNNAPTVTGISPSSGPATGATVVTISGCGFTGALGVDFGTTAAAGFTVNSDSSVSSTSPGHVGGVVDVTVTTANGTSALTPVDQFTFAQGACATASVSPPSPTVPAGSTINFTASSTGCFGPEYEFWVQYPDMSWNLLQGFNGPTFNWNTFGMAPGVYTVHAWVNTSGTGHDAIGSATVTLTGCTSATLAPPTLTQPDHSLVALTASASGCPGPVFEFWVQDPNGNWTLQQGFGANTFNWDTTNFGPGVYTVHAWANQQGAAPTLETYGSSTVTLSGCSAAGLNPPTSNVPAGSTIFFNALSSGCTNPSYEFWIQYPDMSWHLWQGFGSGTFNWDTTGLAPGFYTVHAWINQFGTGHDAIDSATVTLTGCTAGGLAPSTLSQVDGTIVALTASSSTCPNPIYEYWVQYPDGTWHLARGFGGPVFDWDTTGLAPGVYTVHAWANQVGASSTLETYGSSTVTLTGCTSAGLTPFSGASPVGASVLFTASSVGCPTPVYEFWVQYPDGTWHEGQAFSSTNTFTWGTTALAKGNYVIHVWANNSGYTGSYEVIGAATYTLT